MNHFFQNYSSNDRLDEAMEVLNVSFEAKLAAKVSDLSVRRIISQDYSVTNSQQEEGGMQQWMQNEFSKTDLFDPAQLNLLILQSGLTYQYLRELESKKTSKPETAFGHLAQKSLDEQYGATGGTRHVPVFPFTGSFLSQDGLILNVDHEDDLQAYHEADLIE